MPPTFKLNLFLIPSDSLNIDEDLYIPNPYQEAKPYLKDIIRQNRRINLIEDELFIPDFEEQVQQQTGELETLSNTNPIVNSKIAPSTVAQLGAPGTNTSLTQPLKVEDVFKTGIV